LRPPLSLAFFANFAGSIATSTSFDCVAFSVVPVYGFLNNAGPVPCKGDTYTELSQDGALCLHFIVSAWCCTQKRLRKIECKKIWDEDHDAILEEIGRREGLDHDKEAPLGDASGDGSSSSS
jgi:hypothetical protein